IGLQVGGGGFEIGLFGGVDKWIVLRDAVWQAGGARIHIDADDFAENIVELLSGIVRVVAVAAVADAEVKIAIGPEQDRAAVVVPPIVRLLNLQQNAFAGGVGFVGIGF